MTGATRVAQLAIEPAQGVLHEGRGLLPLHPRQRGPGWIALRQQLHQGSGQLLGGAALGLPLEGMPVAAIDPQQPMQLLGQRLALLWPGCAAGLWDRMGHWTVAWAPSHPGAMAQPPRSTQTPIRWLHRLSGLMAQVSRAERLDPADDSLQARRLRQRLSMAQRLLDPLPAPLQPDHWRQRWLWTALRWGGASLALSLWLRR